MREKPILFSGSMVRAILASQKSMTRRVVKPQPTHRLIDGLAHVTVGMNPADDGAVWYDGDCIGPGREVRCLYGRVGDRLWCRETWRITSFADAPYSGLAVEYRADNARRYVEFDEYEKATKLVSEAAPWRPSIFMPRWASRLTLEITGVRCERLNEISEEDAKAEGVEAVSVADVPRNAVWSARQDFAQLWDKINGKRPGCDWASNPWVWAVSFRRVEA